MLVYFPRRSMRYAIAGPSSPSYASAGVLSRVLEDWCAPFPGFFLYYPGRRQVSPALAVFIDAVRVPAKARKSR